MQMDKISDAIHVFIEKDKNRILTKRVHSLSLSLLLQLLLRFLIFLCASLSMLLELLLLHQVMTLLSIFDFLFFYYRCMCAEQSVAMNTEPKRCNILCAFLNIIISICIGNPILCQTHLFAYLSACWFAFLFTCSRTSDSFSICYNWQILRILPLWAPTNGTQSSVMCDDDTDVQRF